MDSFPGIWITRRLSYVVVNTGAFLSWLERATGN